MDTVLRTANAHAVVLRSLAEQFPERPPVQVERWVAVATTREVEGHGGPGGAVTVPVGTWVNFPADLRVYVEIAFPAGGESISVPLSALFPPAAEYEPEQEPPSLLGSAVRAWASGLPAPDSARKDVADEVAYLRSLAAQAGEVAAEHGCSRARGDAEKAAAEADALAEAEGAFGYA